MHVSDCFFRCNATRFLAIRPGVPIDESWPGCFERRHLLGRFVFRLRVCECVEQLTFPCFGPPLSGMSRGHQRLPALAVFGVVREDQANVYLPTTPSVRSDGYWVGTGSHQWVNVGSRCVRSVWKYVATLRMSTSVNSGNGGIPLRVPRRTASRTSS